MADLTSPSDTAGDPARPSRQELATALLLHGAAMFDQELDPALIDPDAALLGGSSIVLGTLTLDSLDSITFLAAVEDELHTSVLDISDIRQVRSLDGLCRFLLDSAPPGDLGRYCARWSAPAETAPGQ
jgi:hypothetical protein